MSKKKQKTMCIRPFSSVKVKCVKHYVKPCLQESKLDQVGSNVLESNVERTATSIVNLAKNSVKYYCSNSWRSTGCTYDYHQGLDGATSRNYSRLFC